MDGTMKILDEIIKRVKNLPEEELEDILGILKSLQAGKQREYQRFSMPLDIDVLIGDKVVKTTMINISASGVFIKTSGKVYAQKDVRVVFLVPGADKPFKLEGKVIRSDPDGLAVEFKKISPYFKQILDDVIWCKSEKSEDDFSK